MFVSNLIAGFTYGLPFLTIIFFDLLTIFKLPFVYLTACCSTKKRIIHQYLYGRFQYRHYNVRKSFLQFHSYLSLLAAMSKYHSLYGLD